MSGGLKTLGAFPRGSLKSTDFSVYGFGGGLNVKDLPQQVGSNDLTVALNGYLRPGGGFASRMGMHRRRNLGTAPIKGLFRFNRLVVAGQPGTMARTLAQCGDSLYWEEAAHLIGSLGNGTQPWSAAMVENPNDPHYSGGLTDCAIICTGSAGPYVYDGAHLYTPSGWSAAAGAQFCAVVNGVVWFGGIPSTPNQIFGTGNGQVGDASMETLPAIRNFALTTPVVGLCAAGTGATAALVIGRPNGVTVLSGTGISNFYEQDLPMSDGVTAGRTMVPDPSGRIDFLGNQAVYASDLADPPIPLSYKVEPYILNDQIVGGYPISSRAACFAWIYNNRYHLSYYSGSAAPWSVQPANTILVFDLMLGGWTVLVTTPGIGAACLLNAASDPAPWQCVVGSSSDGTTYDWDVEPALGANATDAGTPFTVQAVSKYFKVGEPGTVKVLRRLYPELFTCGQLDVALQVYTDYGTSVSSAEQLYPFTTDLTKWDEFSWDQAAWAATARYSPLVAPQTRVDYDGVSGDAFAFGVQATKRNPPWMLGGFTGTYHQRGRV